jgi:DNA-binding winged helix-turn-helix (wHTH) protein
VKALRYHFDEFILSPRRRLLVRNGSEQRLIPRYFDLLVYLVEHRREAVHRRDIFDHVWKDVIVSDSALSQAIRTIRRTLGDDSREPRFVRTVSRHGYRFVFPEVIEAEEDEVWPPSQTISTAADAPHAPAPDPFEPLLELATRVALNANEEEAQREAAELLHELGTSEALRRLATRPRHPFARALLRDTRWDSVSAGTVPILSAPAPVATALALVRLRLRRVARIVAARWASAAIGGGLAGAMGGAAGGLMLASVPESNAPLAVVPVLMVIGLCSGAFGGAGVAAGVSVAEAVARSNRSLALIACAAFGGGFVGVMVQWLARWSLATIVGVHIDTGGGVEGLVIGGAAGIGYAIGTAGLEGGLAAPRGRRRLRVVAATAAACGLGAFVLTLTGRSLIGGTIHAIAQASQGAQATLTPLGRLIGEPDFGPITRIVIGIGEGGLFGLGLALGLTRRPEITNISSNAHRSLKT